MTETLDESAILDVPRHCGQCGYQLWGLPSSGYCPECGLAFAPNDFALFGYRGSRGQPVFKLQERLKVVGVFVIMRIVMGILFPKGGQLLYGSIFVIACVVVLWRRFGSGINLSSPLQVRITRVGFAQRWGLGPVEIIPWRSSDRVVVDRINPSRIRIQILRAEWDRPETSQLDIIIASARQPLEWISLLSDVKLMRV